MPRRKIILFAWLLALTAARADTAWDFALHLDEDYQPAGKISVLLDGANYLVTDKPLGSYRTIERTNYNARQIPADAAVACQGWWGNHDEEMYVQVNPARLFVYRREFFETDPPPPFTLYKTISLKSGAAEPPEPASPPAPAPPKLAAKAAPLNPQPDHWNKAGQTAGAVSNAPSPIGWERAGVRDARTNDTNRGPRESGNFAPPKLTAKPPASPPVTRPAPAPKLPSEGGPSPVTPTNRLATSKPTAKPAAPPAAPSTPDTRHASPSPMASGSLPASGSPVPPVTNRLATSKPTAKPAAPPAAPPPPVTRHTSPSPMASGGSPPAVSPDTRHPSPPPMALESPPASSSPAAVPQAQPAPSPDTRHPSPLTIKVTQVLPMGVRSNEWFSCQVTIANHGDTAISVTNLFNQTAGLELKVTDASGLELGRTFAEPLRNRTWTVPVGKSIGYRVSYGRPGALGAPVILPDTAKTVRVQLQGTIAGSDNSGALTSNIVELDIPE